MEFSQKLKEYKVKIDRLLIERLLIEKQRASSVSEGNTKILDLIINFCSRGGKRIRPILFIKGYEAVGGRDIQEIMRISICIELLEAYVLIHDDIIDQDTIRRGGPAFHEMAKDWTGDVHFGLSSAIVAGDMLGNLSTKIIIEANFKETLKLRALNEFVEAELNCFHGELYDVILEKQSAAEEEFFRMVDLKTSSYTTKAPLVMGAILGNGTEEQIEILREYGRLLGRAFQITDDILGTFGDEQNTGKPAASDIKQGKKTLLLLHALQNANPQEAIFLRNAIGNKNLTPQQIEEVRKIFIRTKALDYAKDLASKYVAQANSTLSSSNLKETEFLTQLTYFIANRKS